MTSWCWCFIDSAIADDFWPVKNAGLYFSATFKISNFPHTAMFICAKLVGKL